LPTRSASNASKTARQASHGSTKTIEERPESLTSLHAETDARIEKLIGLAEIRQREIETHGTQIEALLTLAGKHAQSQANLERQWQACIDALPRQ
jgi:hypothetical protein